MFVFSVLRICHIDGYLVGVTTVENNVVARRPRSEEIVVFRQPGRISIDKYERKIIDLIIDLKIAWGLSTILREVSSVPFSETSMFLVGFCTLPQALATLANIGNPRDRLQTCQ
jgi:hypothetical protein